MVPEHNPSLKKESFKVKLTTKASRAGGQVTSRSKSVDAVAVQLPYMAHVRNPRRAKPHLLPQLAALAVQKS